MSKKTISIKREYIIAAIIGLVLIVGISAKTYLTEVFGLGNEAAFAIGKISAFLFSFFINICFAVAAIKYVFPNTLGVDFGDTFDECWEKLKEEKPTWVPIISLSFFGLLILSGAIILIGAGA